MAGDRNRPGTSVLAWIVIALMAVATAYTGWIAIVNFSRIGV